jgi:hypothetical protein
MERGNGKLFDRIILAISREKELRQSRKLLFGFLFLAVLSVAATPFSAIMLGRQLENSGIYYVISAAFGNFKTFLALWQNFGLAILESLPVSGLLVFLLSVGTALFTVRLFLHKKGVMLGYLRHGFN